MAKIALFHPWIKSHGGAEKIVLEILKDKKNDFDIYTWVYDKENTFKEFEDFKINVIAPKFVEKLSRHYLLRGFIFPITLFSKIPLEKYDFFLISTSGFAELITFRNYKPGKTGAYVYTILRASYKNYVSWDLKYRFKNLLGKGTYLAAAYTYRILEKIAWKKLDRPIFMSELILKRAKDHNLVKGKKTSIAYPPVNTDRFKNLKRKKGKYFLYVSRFHPLKRQNVLINAWSEFVKKHPEQKLVLAGGIENESYFKELKELAGKTKNIEFKVNLNDKDLLSLYEGCLAGIFVPFREDFGIVPFEILSTGKPLIAVDQGGYVELVKDLPQVFLIKEKKSNEALTKEIVLSLEKFLKSKVKPKKINFKELNTKNFGERLIQLLN